MGRHPRTQTICFGIVPFKHYHPRYSKTRFVAYGVQWYWCLERHPRTQTMFFGIVYCKYTHPRYPKTLFVAYGVQWYVRLGRHPRTQTIVFCIVHCNHPHPRYPKHLFWPMVFRGMGVWGATPEPEQYFFGVIRPRTPVYPFMPVLRLSISPPEKGPRLQVFFLVRDPPALATPVKFPFVPYSRRKYSAPSPSFPFLLLS